MNVTLGGERLGSGNKQKISMRNYERSTHDIGYTWRSSMAAGTLVPFMSELALPGDTHDIELNMSVLTLPTIGPLFGSYKVQADIFLCPMRIYNGKLHMNMLGIGNDMSRAKIPQIGLSSHHYADEEIDDNSQINSSALYSYLNIRGLGVPSPNTDGEPHRMFNAIPLLAYYDIYKQYYANKQEERGFIIHTDSGTEAINMIDAKLYGSFGEKDILDIAETVTGSDITSLVIIYSGNIEPNLANVVILKNDIEVRIDTLFETVNFQINTPVTNNSQLTFTNYSGDAGSVKYEIQDDPIPNPNPYDSGIILKEFPLENIDNMRMSILKHVDSDTAFVIDEDNPDIADWVFPYYSGQLNVQDGEKLRKAMLFSQEGLAIKTYQSDLFNNWISTEWIDGDGGVNEISAVSVDNGSFTIDALNLASKVYVMLNRIALSGGTYDDWLDAVYTHERAKSMENPAYQGSLIKELAFEEVISNAASDEQPLGTLAGRGNLTNKHKGGKIRVKVDEPSYIMGIVSITPRIDYSQGNKWDTNLKDWSQLHAPALDAIGFEDLITDQMAWFDTLITNDDEVNFKSAGKQPAWINYMTNVNQVRGHFAEKNNAMWMTLNRRYDVGDNGEIEDLTTYVDPTKFNHIFADTNLDAQNFWVQIRVDNIARRKMSAKVIPNL